MSDDFADLDLDVTLRGFRVGQKVFDRYTLRSVLGRGGMGVVWLAIDERLEREVALKFLPELVVRDKLAVADLKRETNRCLALTHPHIVRVHDFVEDPARGIAAISMEFIDGDNLSNLRAGREHPRFEVEELRPWVRQLCDALTYAHEKARVVHRDLKPANLMLTKGGELKIADFGIARSLVDSASRVSAQPSATSGTLAYMSPQQALGRAATVADDVYALGATLYDLLSGRPPFFSGNVYEQVKEVVPPSIAERCEELGASAPAIPANWEQTIAACLAKDPAARPQSIAEVWARLEGLPLPKSSAPATAPGASRAEPIRVGARPEPQPAPRGKGALIFALLLLLAAAGGAGWYFGSYKPAQDRAKMAAGAEEARAAEQQRAAKAAEQADAEKAAAAAVKAAEEKQAAEKMAAARGGLELTTDPPGASVKVGGIAKGTTPANFADLRVGKYPLTVELPGYDPIERDVEVKPDAFTNLGLLKLQRSHGTAQIISTPSGQKFELKLKSGDVATDAPIDRSGTTPATLEQLPTGIYTVHLQREGWPDYTGELTVKRGAVVPLQWDFAEGTARIVSEPPGAAVLLDGKPAGTAPCSITAPTGDHRIALALPGWPDAETTLQVSKGANPDFRWEFATSSARLTSIPPGAEVTLRPRQPALETAMETLRKKEARYAEKGLSKAENASLKTEIAALKAEIAQKGKDFAIRTAKTPAEFTDLKTGSYTASFTRPGWPEQRVEVLVSKGQVASAEAEFSQGTVKAESRPSGATVLDGDRVLGKTPLTAELPTGEHTLRFQQPDWPAIPRPVRIVKGQTATVEAAFIGGDLDITSEPSGATVTREGKSIGSTPLSLKNQPPGDVKLSFSKSGYKSVTANARVTSGGKAEARGTLEKFSFAGTWSGTSTGKGSDGSTGTSTVTFHVSADERSIECDFGGGPPFINTSCERSGDELVFFPRQNPGSDGTPGTWTANCRISSSGSYTRSLKYVSGDLVGTTVTYSGTLRHR